ncbi:PTS transporter subunit IIC [Virgibacillus halodenitrificans]|uniref:PTS sugar transporter subunit IIC n=1 Tax=Virgibacillus halodenitrificans TaxID=1482 RepID=A0AAC9IZK5_VIRHA|nr:PTS sugar transporter subunit IIC [Virgibacillus halodenitrificans]APC47000.1 PTS sugar transporter subunit IIC [Virgibacillus halodenitrificans]MBD1223044.1 PTS sugar transporter subunit IIC [Virgibacillus halodenitrificans]MCG1027402.1 PTS sugar transporter subunit IIC [Virgibacillus halodenitrificans]WHX25272.1 PTS sugar transporter subunit IIC [Virgibacillus halodenitrificans]CDQ37202.1 putative membrane protein, putative toxin regulator [Virgibacillus halodenitrificans]
MKAFLNRKGISLSANEYIITALSFMALGLFSSLIIGLIIKTAGEQIVVNFSPELASVLIEMGSFAMDTKIMGGAIGVAIAYGLKAPPLVLLSALFAGAFGAELGGPAGSYVSALFATEFGKLVYKETKVDIIITPLVTIVIGFMVGTFIGPPINSFMLGFGEIVNWSTEQQPFIMGVLVAILMGLALTAPISSAAIAIMLSLDGLAAGAAAVGCSAQMIGFAVASYRDNGFGGFLALGIGTSMLQVANILRKPIILLPPTIAGAILAPFATVWLKLTNNASGAGMGTSGFVGQIMTFESMGFSMNVVWSVVILHIVAPAIIAFLFAELLRKKGWIKPGDMKITYE